MKDGTDAAAENPAALEISVGGAELIPALEPLWLSLFDHHRRVGPGPFIARQDSWAVRRRFYEQVLKAPECFVVVAKGTDRLVGYALVDIHQGPDDTWPTGDRFAEVESLAVLPESRGEGIGSLLLDVVDRRLEELGIHTLFIGVMAGNDDALRLYRRRGLVPSITKLMRVGGGAPQPGDPTDDV